MCVPRCLGKTTLSDRYARPPYSFYRNLFARLNSLDQFALIQLLSSFWVCIWYPFSMTPWCHTLISYFTPEPKSWEEYVESVGICA